MTFLRILSLSCLLVACRDERLSGTAGDLLVQPERVQFGQHWVGFRATTPVELQNTARQPLDVTLIIGTPFDVQQTVRVGGGERVSIELGVTPESIGPVTSTLLITYGENTREVSVAAEGISPPVCPARDCHVFTFDPVSGTCVDTVQADGASCGATNQCLTNGVCRAGECLGQAKSCDDADRCTMDACDAATGCIHDALACPGSSNPCEVPVCNAQTGCGLTPAFDGVTCGSNDCITAHVCIAGQCTTRAAPDGSECAAPTSCRGTGLCRAQQCELPAPSPLQPRWRYTPPTAHTVTFLGHADDLGNLYATERWNGSVNAQGDAPMKGAAEDRAGVPAFFDAPQTALLSLSPTGVVRFRVVLDSNCAGCTGGLPFAIDSGGHRLFVNVHGGELQARSTDDGHLLWSVTPTSGIPVFDRGADGGGVFFTSPPLLIAADVVGVPVTEGNGDHHSYVEAYDRATGARRFEFHRKGHLYGTGVASNGELWTSSADCWAPAGEMTRLDAMGNGPTRFVSWIPNVYGADFAIGTAAGKLHQLDSSFVLHDLSSLTMASVASVPLVSGQQLTLFDGAARTLHSVDLTGQPRGFSFTGVTGRSPDFELLRDGGTAWTATADGGVLGAIDAEGRELLQCPLATSVESPTTIIHGRAYVQSEGTIVSYDVAGLEVETQGWLSRGGSLGRAGRAR